MTKFNPDNKEVLTYGECLHPAMKITDQEDATQYLADYVSFIQKYLDKEPRTDNKSALEIAKINLGYFAGYYDHETMQRVNKLFCCEHPIFGKTMPTPKEAFDAGVKLGRLTQKGE